MVAGTIGFVSFGERKLDSVKMIVFFFFLNCWNVFDVYEIGVKNRLVRSHFSHPIHLMKEKTGFSCQWPVSQEYKLALSCNEKEC